MSNERGGTLRDVGSANSNEDGGVGVEALRHGIGKAIRAVRKHWFVGFAVAAAIILATALYTFGQKPMYEAEGEIEFDPNPPTPLGSTVNSVVERGQRSSRWMSTREYYQTQFRIIKSRRTASDVVRRLGLNRDSGFILNASPGEKIETEEVSVDAAAAILRSRLRVKPVRNARMAIVYYRDADPERAQRLLTSILNTYVEENLNTMVSSAESAGEWLNSQLSTLKEDLKVTEHALHNFKQDEDILSVSLEDQNNILKHQIETFSSELAATQLGEAKAAARVKNLEKVSAGLAELGAPDVRKSEILVTLREQYLKAKLAFLDVKTGNKGKNHPSYLAAQAREETSKQALLDEIENTRVALKHELRTLSTERTLIQQLLRQTRKRAHSLGLVEIDYNRLRRARDNTEKLYGVFLERTKGTDIAMRLRVNNVRVLDPPLLPPGPVSPRVSFNLTFGGLFALLIGVGAAWVRGRLDQRISTPEAAETELGMPVLGVLPDTTRREARSDYYLSYAARTPKRRERKKAKPTAPNTEPEHPDNPALYAHAAPRSALAEAVRALRTNILLMSPDKPEQVLLVTSSQPGEGKTTVAAALAISIAQAGHRVLLVDCDLRRARLHHVFDKPDDTSVSSVLLDPAAFDRDDYSTQVPGLSLLPAGPPPPDPAELFHSTAFANLLEAAKEKYDQIILDSPPVGPVTDAVILSAAADATLLVVRSDQTSKTHALRSIRTLSTISARILGIVFNGMTDQSFGRGGRYDYRYQAYHGYSDASREEQKPPPPVHQQGA